MMVGLKTLIKTMRRASSIVVNVLFVHSLLVCEVTPCMHACMMC